MEGEVEVKMGTLSKIIPSIGGYIAGKKDLTDYLKHNARAFIFSASLPPAAVAASIASFEVMDEEPGRREKLWHNVKLFRDGLQKLGFDTMNSETPIIPVLMDSEERAQLMTRKLQQRGIFICYILPPAVPPNTSRLRATVTAAHSDEDIEQALEAFAKAGKEMGMI